MTKHLRYRPCDVSDSGCREQPYRFRGPERLHCAVVRVQQHQPRNTFGPGKGPVNSRWTRGIVRDEDYLLKPQLGDDGIQVTGLTAAV